MIIDCDTHCMLPDAFDYLPPELAPLAPRIQITEEDGSYDVVDFPGRWAPVAGATPKARTGNKLRGAAFVEDRVEDMERQKVDRHMLMCNFTGWWSYLLGPDLGAAMAHSQAFTSAGTSTGRSRRKRPSSWTPYAYLGADRFLFATDYPHDDPGGLMKWQDVDLLAQNDRITEADKETIRHVAAEKLFRLP